MAEWKSLVLPLAYPIDGVSELRFTEPSAAALEEIADAAAGGNEVRTMIATIEALLVDQDQRPIARKLHRDDFTAVSEKLAPFTVGYRTSAAPKP